MFTRSLKTASVRRALLAGVFAVTGALTIGAATEPAHAQYYSYQYNNPYYSNYQYQNQYQNDYQARYAWWRHQYWRWYHENYR
jgi:hypothetical protein